ncbi:MAG: DUF1800 family protein [Rudaea sp.]
MRTSLCVFAYRARSLAFGLIVGGGAGMSANAVAALSHGPDPLFHDGVEGITAGPFNDSDASRFLAQATFGPTDTDIAHIRSVGYNAWLSEQFAAAASHELTYLDWATNTLGEDIGQGNRQEAWFLAALGGHDPAGGADHTDQLRQRVAFALSEILVISDQNTTLSGYPEGMAYMYDMLVDNAFGNYRQLLEKVTLSPAMGVYLNMMGNRRADLVNNLHPDENYGREINQLFGIGLVMLNIDGTPQLSGGQQIPTYTQNTITNFAHVFTGWSWHDCDEDQGVQFAYDQFTYCFPPYEMPQDFRTPMIPFDTTIPLYPNNSPSYHDNGTDATNDVVSKQLLLYPGVINSGILVANGTAASDLQFALDNIYNHPNVAPFISKQLIQRLVTSNPSTDYVTRVATVFNANRSSATQLREVVKAILLDPEARLGQWRNADTFGKLREPLLTLTHFWRAMDAKHMCGTNFVQTNDDNSTTNYKYKNQPYRYAGYSTVYGADDVQYGVGVGQAAMDALTVFNFFKPSFAPSGELTARGLVAPEFQLQTDSVIANTGNSATYRAYGLDIADTCDDQGNTTYPEFGDVKVNHAKDLALAGSGQGGSADPSDRLVDAYNKRFMSGQMSPYMRDQLITYLNKIDHNWANGTDDWRLQRIYRALYLIFTSPEYMVQK